MSQVVAGEDVAEEVSLEVIVGSGGEGVGECAPRELALHFGALSEGVVISGQGVGVASFRVCDACDAALFGDALQGAQCVEAAREAGVSIELREGLFDLVQGQAVV